MGKNYPSFQPSYSHEDLVEHFLLTPGELELILKCRGDANRCGIALLLKSLPHLGYMPDRLDEIPKVNLAAPNTSFVSTAFGTINATNTPARICQIGAKVIF